MDAGHVLNAQPGDDGGSDAEAGLSHSGATLVDVDQSRNLAKSVMVDLLFRKDGYNSFSDEKRGSCQQRIS